MPQLILFSFLVFAVWLIRRDVKNRPGVSSAIWIPTIWVGILASRPVSSWIGSGGIQDTLDGSPVDRLFYLSMILASIVTLSRRGINWGWLIAKNWPVFLFYSFLLLSIVWANSPFVSFKRWFKETGNIFVALVILTEVNPLQAFRSVFVRCAYVLIPLSIIFLRYFPSLGRRYNSHSGELEAIGVTFQKNSLGTMVLVCTLVFIWDWIERSQAKDLIANKLDRYLGYGLAIISVYLMYVCDSKTSMLSLIVGAIIIYSIRLPLLRRRISSFGVYSLFAAMAFFFIDRNIGIMESVVSALGRDMTLTGRTDVWRELLNVGTDPLLGTGFMSFWDDYTFRTILPSWVSSSAHNGYLEIYLAGGAVGVTILAIMILGIGVRLNRDLSSNDNYSVVRFAVFVAALLANFAESNFACMTPLGFLFILAAIGTARQQEYAPEWRRRDDPPWTAFTDEGVNSQARTVSCA